MKRIIYILAIALVMAIALGGVSVSADYGADNLTRGGTNVTFDAQEAPEDTAENGSTAAEVTDGESIATTPTYGENTDGAVDTTDGKNTDGAADSNDKSEDGADKTDGGNPFAAMFEAVKEYATEIFCSLSLACSLVLAYCYKRGLIPLLTGGLNSLSGVVKSVKESTERGEGETRELAKIVSARLTEAENALDIITASVTDLAARLDELKDDKDEKAELKIILGAQVDMLYSIFMTSALPQYQKDEVGARIAEMRHALGLTPAPKGGAAVEGE